MSSLVAPPANIAQTPEGKTMNTITADAAIRDNIVAHILDSGRTIGEIADATGHGRADLRSILAGHGTLAIGLIGSIADAIGVKPSELINVTERAPWDPSTLEGLKIVAILDDRGRELVLWEDDEQTFRHAFEIELNMGEMTATIRMFKGAASGDLNIARGNLRRAQSAGFDYLWRKETRDGTDFWILSGLQHGEGKNFGYPRFDNELRRCTDEACAETFHTWSEVDGVEEQEEPCTLDSIVGADGYYSVYAETAPEGKWQVSAAVDLPDGPAAVKVAGDLLNDLRWMQGECDRLNGRGHEATIKGLKDSFNEVVEEISDVIGGDHPLRDGRVRADHWHPQDRRNDMNTRHPSQRLHPQAGVSPRNDLRNAVDALSTALTEVESVDVPSDYALAELVWLASRARAEAIAKLARRLNIDPDDLTDAMDMPYSEEAEEYGPQLNGLVAGLVNDL